MTKDGNPNEGYGAIGEAGNARLGNPGWRILEGKPAEQPGEGSVRFGSEQSHEPGKLGSEAGPGGGEASRLFLMRPGRKGEAAPGKPSSASLREDPLRLCARPGSPFSMWTGSPFSVRSGSRFSECGPAAASPQVPAEATPPTGAAGQRLLTSQDATPSPPRAPCVLRSAGLPGRGSRRG